MKRVKLTLARKKELARQQVVTQDLPAPPKPPSGGIYPLPPATPKPPKDQLARQ